MGPTRLLRKQRVIAKTNNSGNQEGTVEEPVLVKIRFDNGGMVYDVPIGLVQSTNSTTEPGMRVIAKTNSSGGQPGTVMEAVMVKIRFDNGGMVHAVPIRLVYPDLW